MAAGRGNNVGHLSVRVTPDAIGFRDSLRREIERQVKSMTAIQVPKDKILVNRATVDSKRVQAQIQGELKGVKVTVGAELSQRSSQRIRKQLDDLAEERRAEIVPFADRDEIVRTKDMFQRLADRMDLKLDVEYTNFPELYRQVRNLREQYRGAVAELKFAMDETTYEETLAKIHLIKDELDDLEEKRKAYIEAETLTLAASARLAWLTRPRFVSILPRLEKAAVAKVTTALAALSGARLGYDYMKRFTDWVSELDKKLPALAGSASIAAAGIAALMSAVAGTVSVGRGIVEIAPTLLTLPGMMMSAALSVTALIIAWRKAGEVMPDVKEQWKSLGPIISDNYWAVAEKSVRRFSNTVMPQLKRSFADAAKAMGSFTATFADEFTKQLTDGNLERMFAGLTGFWGELERGANAFARAITNLGLVGARYMPRFGAWFTDLSIRFDNWLADVASDGRLDSWIERGIDNLYALWDVVTATSGIFKGLWRAADNAGFRGIQGLADALERWNATVNGFRWQRTLTELYSASSAAMGSFADAFSVFGRSLDAARTEVGRFIRETSAGLGRVFGSLFKTFGSREFRRSIDELTNGLKRAFTALEPAMAPLGRMLGKFLELVGQLAGSLAPVIAELLTAVEPVFNTLVDIATQLADVLAGVLAPAIKLLGALVAPFARTLSVLALAFAGLAVVNKAATWMRNFGASTSVAAANAGLVQKSAMGAANATTTAAGSMTRSGKAAVGLGLALAGVEVAYWAMDKASQSMRVSSDQVTNLVHTQQNAWSVLKKSVEGNNTWLMSSSSAFDDMGGSLKRITSSMSALNMTIADRTLKGTLEDFGAGLADLSAVDFTRAQQQFRAFADATKLTREEQLKALSTMPEFRAVLAEAATGMGRAADDATLLALATGELDRSAAVAAGGLSNLTMDVNTHSEALRNARHAGREVKNSLDAIRESIAAGNVAWGENTRAGRDNMDMVDAHVLAIRAEADAMAKAGEASKVVGQRMRESRAALVEMMTGFGLSREAAEAYIDTVAGLPESAITEIEVQLKEEEAQRRLKNLKAPVKTEARLMLIPDYSGREWRPPMKLPFDPVAQIEAELKLEEGSKRGIAEEFKLLDPAPFQIKTDNKGVKAGVVGASALIATLAGKVVPLIADPEGARTGTEQAQLFVRRLEGKTVEAKAEAKGRSSVEQLTGTVARMQGKTVVARANAVGHSAVSSLNLTVARMQGKTVVARANTYGGGAVQSILNTLSALRRMGNIVVSVSLRALTSGLPSRVKSLLGLKHGGTVEVPGYSTGGTIWGMNGGVRNGTVYGAGTRTSDSVLVRLSRGEEVIRAQYASKFRPLLKLLNKGIIPTVEAAPIVVNVSALKQAQLDLQSNKNAAVFRDVVGAEVGAGMVQGASEAVPELRQQVRSMLGDVSAASVEAQRASSGPTVNQSNNINMLDRDPRLVFRQLGREIEVAL